MKVEIIDIEEIRTNTYEVLFSNDVSVVVYAPNINTAIIKAEERIKECLKQEKNG